jgi:YVTN family beta-propeller protein
MTTSLSFFEASRTAAAFVAALVLAAGPAAAGEAASTSEKNSPAPGIHQRLVREGIAVDVAMEPITSRGAGFQQGDPFRLRIEITDDHTGAGLNSLYPAAWLDLLPAGRDPLSDGPRSCRDKVEAFIGGALLAQPEVDLNVYYVLALNDEATISVVDPLFGFGGSKLLDMVFLKSPGEDWELTEDQRRLFVSMPDSDQIAVVDTATWRVETNVDVGRSPRRIALQHDERYLWVAWDGDADSPSGVSVIDTAVLREVARFATGRGRRGDGPGKDLAVSDDDRFVYATNPADGSVSIFDVAGLEQVRDVETGGEPRSLAYSSKSRALYVSDAAGFVAIVDGRSHEVVGRAEAEPGLDRIRLAPGERLAFVVNPESDTVHILDVASGRIVQTADVEDRPFEVAFSDELAYVAHRGSEIVLMIPLGDLGREGAPVPAIDFPGGEKPPGAVARPAVAETMVQAPGASAVLVSNPGDQAIYYYKEGMAAPMGHFKNYGRQPRAVAVVDRSLQETGPGVYETANKLLEPGKYDLAIFVDSPRVIECFEIDVAPSPERLAAEQKKQAVTIRALHDSHRVTVGERVPLRFELTKPATGEPRTGLGDVNVLTFLAPGVWQQRQWAKEVGEGIYEIDFTPPQSGIYYVFLQVQSLGLTYSESRSLVLEATSKS